MDKLVLSELTDDELNTLHSNVKKEVEYREYRTLKITQMTNTTFYITKFGIQHYYHEIREILKTHRVELYKPEVYTDVIKITTYDRYGIVSKMTLITKDIEKLFEK